MKLFIAVLLWLIVFTFLPMVAIAALILLPIVWVISLPFRLASLLVEAFLLFIKGLLFLPARMLGVRTAT
jgi:hypothetical protein